jgi:DNA-binding CsgD family transcriptional regulator/type II secretory pathway predicted ATPase ExeA
MSVVGREAELELTVEHVVEHGQVLVAGEAGVGKTTLLDATASSLLDRGFVVARATGSSALVGHPLAALGHVIGDPGRRTGPALVDFATERLRALARGSRAVIVVDDAHALDAWSLQAIGQARLAEGPRTVLAARSAPSLSDTVASFGRHPGLRVELQRLSLDETAALVAVVLGGAMDTPSVSRVHMATDGLPLAIVEVVRYAVRRGAVVERSGLYRWIPGVSIDRHLAALLGLRIDELGADERDVVDVLTIVGELPLDIVRRVVPNADLASMEQQRLLAVTPRPGWVMVGHPLLREAAAAQLETVRRHELSRRLVAALATETSAELERTAVFLAVDIGAPVADEAVLATVEWGRAHAMWKVLLPVMARAWADLPSPTTGLAYGEALYWTRRMDESAAVFAAAEALCSTERERIVISTARARALDIGLGRSEEADAIRAAQLDGHQDAADRLEALCGRAERWVFDGEVARILEVAAWVDGVADDSAPFQAARYRFTQSSVPALGLSGQLGAMEREYELHLRLSEDHAGVHPLGREVVDPWWAACNLIAGRPGGVVELIGERYSSALDLDDGLSRPLWALPMAIERLLGGDLPAAEHFAREAMGVPAEVVSIRRMATHYLARTLELAGRHEEALGHARATAGDDYVGIVRAWSVGIEHRCLLATRRSLAPAVVRESLDRARAAIDDALALGQRITAAYVAHDLLGSGIDADLAGLLEGLTTTCDAPVMRWMAVDARARSGGSVHELVDVVDEATGAGVHGLARSFAEVAVQLAVARRDVATASRADQVLARCRERTVGFADPAAGGDLGARYGLSPRESEVMNAAVAGLTDQEIAADLVISVRTVNAHLRSVYRKVGVSGRRELRALWAADD